MASRSKYRTIVADPPWRVNNPSGWGKGTSAGSRWLPYSTMTVPEICALPVENVAEDVAHLYLWTVNRHIESAYEVVRAWGFKPSTLLTWTKSPHGPGPGGHFVQTTEFVLFARRGVEGRNPSRRIETTWWHWPRGKHSEKPDAFLDVVEEVSPGPYLELFARRARIGWDAWGDESPGTAELLA
jgi:N6-adenosine-specific RNA methylase IME4